MTASRLAVEATLGLKRILLVEDFELWRDWIRSFLIAYPQLELVGEAVDGFEAIEKTSRLRPDLVLMDIHLPGLNGLQAAKIIQMGFGITVVFLSANCDASTVAAALATGAKGYVLKTRARMELIPTIEAALRDRAEVLGQIRDNTDADKVEAPRSIAGPRGRGLGHGEG